MSLALRMPWIMSQRWEHLLYLHYRVDSAQLRAMLPAELELDEFDGSGWVTIVPFRMEHVHLRDLIPIPGTKQFPEINLRTYVTRNGVPAVWFMSIDAASWMSVHVAHFAFHLPYFDARMTFEQNDGGFHLKSRRKKDDVEFDVRYRPKGVPSPPMPNTIDAHLAERYVMFAPASRGGRLLVGDISHSPWNVQPVEVEVGRNDVLAAAGITPLSPEPLAAFSPGTHAVAWPMSRSNNAFDGGAKR